MSTVSKMLTILASLFVLTSCGLEHLAGHTNVAGYPYRYTAFDYKYAWKTTQTDHGVAIDGVMKNVRYPYIDSLQVTVFVLGKDENTFARATTFPAPQQSREGDVCHYSLLLRGIKPVPGDRYEFLVHYRGTEGGNGGVDWISSFKADALTGTIIRPPARDLDEW